MPMLTCHLPAEDEKSNWVREYGLARSDQAPEDSSSWVSEQAWSVQAAEYHSWLSADGAAEYEAAGAGGMGQGSGQGGQGEALREQQPVGRVRNQGGLDGGEWETRRSWGEGPEVGRMVAGAPKGNPMRGWRDEGYAGRGGREGCVLVQGAWGRRDARDVGGEDREGAEGQGSQGSRQWLFLRPQEVSSSQVLPDQVLPVGSGPAGSDEE